MLKEWAKPSFSRLTTMLMSPWRQRVDVLRACAGPPWRSRARRSSFSNSGGRGLSIGELDELDAGARRAWRQRRQARNGGAGPAPQLVEHEEQRALAVDRDAARRAGAELVVEDLEREQPVVAGGLERVHEVVDRQLALAGKERKWRLQER